MKRKAATCLVLGLAATAVEIRTHSVAAAFLATFVLFLALLGVVHIASAWRREKGR